ncbi:MAG: Crp/Fnr family transcriptional regulator [Candidatus Levybacteria bacterium]|nr:Crp/Fnr family transcriptional regulator [Candidatus Levybacteria bacterium]
MNTEQFKRETSKKIKLFFSQFKILTYKKNDIVSRSDDIPSGVFYLKKGCVRLYSLSKDGEELTLILFKPQNIFPLIWAINNTSMRYYLEAMTPVEIFRSPREKFIEFIKSNPDVLYELLKRTLARSGDLMERMEYLVFGDAYAKIASILLILADRFGEEKDKGIVIQIPLTHKDIAALTGVTRETASLDLGKIEKKGIISFKGRKLIIKNLKVLKKESLLNI